MIVRMSICYRYIIFEMWLLKPCRKEIKAIMIIDRNNKVYSAVKRKYAYSVQKQIYMVYQGKMDLRKIKNSIS